MLRSLPSKLSYQRLHRCLSKQVCAYSRGWRDTGDGWQSDTDFAANAELDEPEDLDDLLKPDVTNREKERRRKVIAFKTIERKYFKPSQEVNLLTWDAKEQIRYLAAEFPEEWTIERLAESFPVSRDGVQRLLKSRFAPASLQETVKHDRRVQKHWLALTQGRKDNGKSKVKTLPDVSGGPIASRYEQLEQEGKLHLLANADGIASLPQPSEVKRIPQNAISSHDPPTSEPGVFTSILKDYYDNKPPKKKSSKLVEAESEDVLHHLHKDTQVLLSGMVQSLPIPDQKKNQHGENTGARDVKTEPGLSGTHGNVVETQVSSLVYNSILENDDETLTDMAQRRDQKRDCLTTTGVEPSEVEPVKPRRSLRSRRLAASSHVELTLHENLAMRSVAAITSANIDVRGMENTGKIDNPTAEDVILVNNVYDQEIATRQAENVATVKGNDRGRTRRKFSESEADSVLRGLRYDVPVNTRAEANTGRQHREAYIYDEHTGYQNPLGKVASQAKDKLPPRRSRKPQSASSHDIIQHGKNVYDIDGEFLYRIP